MVAVRASEAAERALVVVTQAVVVTRVEAVTDITTRVMFQSGVAPYPPTYPSHGDFGKKLPHSMLQIDGPELRVPSDHFAVQNQTAEAAYPPPACRLFVVVFRSVPRTIAER